MSAFEASPFAEKSPDFSVLDVQGVDFHATGDFRAERENPAAEAGEEACRIEVAVLGEVNRAGKAHGDRGIEPGARGGVEHLRLKSDLACGGRNGGFFIKAFCRFAEHQHPPFGEAELFFLGEFCEKPTAFEIQVAEEFAGFLDVFRVGVAVEEPGPAGERGVESWADVEGALRVEHPAESLGDHPRGCEGNEMTGDNHPGIAHGAIVATWEFALDQGHGHAALQGIVGGTESDHSAAKHDHALIDWVHVLILSPASCRRLEEFLWKSRFPPGLDRSGVRMQHDSVDLVDPGRSGLGLFKHRSQGPISDSNGNF